MKKPVVKVMWNDAYGTTEEFNEKAADSMVNESVGYLVKRSKRSIVVAQDYCLEDDSYHTYTVIPRSLVIKIIYLLS